MEYVSSNFATSRTRPGMFICQLWLELGLVFKDRPLGRSPSTRLAKVYEYEGRQGCPPDSIVAATTRTFTRRRELCMQRISTAALRCVRWATLLMRCTIETGAAMPNNQVGGWL